MRIQVLSDLHLQQAPFAIPEAAADLIVLAGDIARPAEAFMAFAARFDRPLVAVAGNHDFYDARVDEARAALYKEARRHGVILLDRRCCIRAGVRILGCTLWTDFALFGAEHRAQAQAMASSALHDFKRIRNPDGSGFQPADSAAWFAADRAWLAAALAQPFAGATVVVTHHAPSRRSVPLRFADTLLSAAFASDLEDLMPAVDVWIHGHLHDSFDYRVGRTRVVCNPRGYHRAGGDENAAFDPAFCIEV